MNDLSDIDRAEAQLWDAVRGLSLPGHSKARVAAAAVEALRGYRAAVEAQLLARHAGSISR